MIIFRTIFIRLRTERRKNQCCTYGFMGGTIIQEIVGEDDTLS